MPERALKDATEAAVPAPETEKREKEGTIHAGFVFDPFDYDALKPYQGKGSLPEPKRKQITDPKTGVKKLIVIEDGAPRFFVNGRKLIAVYKSTNGTKRRLARMMFDHNNRNARYQQDRAYRQELRKRGIPGA